VRGLEQLERIAVPRGHERRQHLDLEARDVGEKAHTVGDAVLVRPQDVEHIAHQVERALLNPLGVNPQEIIFGDRDGNILGFAGRALGNEQPALTIPNGAP